MYTLKGCFKSAGLSGLLLFENSVLLLAARIEVKQIEVGKKSLPRDPFTSAVGVWISGSPPEACNLGPFLHKLYCYPMNWVDSMLFRLGREQIF
jgi:hypothetical protein